MKWKKEGKKQIAEGKYGKFVIEQIKGVYRATYIGTMANFIFPRTLRIKKLKEMCENNYYWED